MKRIYIIVALLTITGCYGIEASLSAIRSGTYNSSIDPQCIKIGLASDSRVNNIIEESVREDALDGRIFIRHNYSYTTKDSNNKKRFLVSVDKHDSNKTSLNHSINLAAINMAGPEQYQELVLEVKMMAEIEQKIGAACKIPNIEKIMKRHQ